jgi:uncharacterized protein
MTDFLAALGLLLVIEGVLYAAFPRTMKRIVAHLVTTPEEQVRWIALGSAVLGLAIVWAVRG